MAIEKIGFIGGGNMACAIIAGIKGMPVTVGVSDPAGCNAEAELFSDNVILTQWADLVVFAVKPHIMPSVMKEVAPVAAEKPFISIAAGISTSAISAALPGARTLRVMPNTPAMLRQGMSVFALPHTLSQDELAFAKAMFACVGSVAEVGEGLMAAVTSLSGSGPAYFFLLIEAMADAGVKNGLPRALAYQLASQTAVGSGIMVRDSGRHPGVLKDEVCSPYGTTIAAIAALEHAGARAAMMDAVEAAYRRAKELEA